MEAETATAVVAVGSSGDTAQIVLSAVLVIVTVVYVVLTHRMASTAERSREEGLVPHFVVDLELADRRWGAHPPEYVVRVLNAGPGIARDVRVLFDFVAPPNTHKVSGEERSWRSAALVAGESHFFYPPRSLDGRTVTADGQHLGASEIWTAVEVHVDARRVDGVDVEHRERIDVGEWRRVILDSGERFSSLDRDPVAEAIREFTRLYRAESHGNPFAGTLGIQRADPVKVVSVPDPWLVRRVRKWLLTLQELAKLLWSQSRRGHSARE